MLLYWIHYAGKEFHICGTFAQKLVPQYDNTGRKYVYCKDTPEFIRGIFTDYSEV